MAEGEPSENLKVEEAEGEEIAPESEEQALALNSDGLQYWLREVILENIKLERQLKASKDSRLLAAEICRHGHEAILQSHQRMGPPGWQGRPSPGQYGRGPRHMARPPNGPPPNNPLLAQQNGQRADRKRKRAAMQAAEVMKKQAIPGVALEDGEASISQSGQQPSEGSLGQDSQSKAEILLPLNGSTPKTQPAFQQNSLTGSQGNTPMQTMPQAAIRPAVSDTLMKTESDVPTLDFIQRQRGLL